MKTYYNNWYNKLIVSKKVPIERLEEVIRGTIENMLPYNLGKIQIDKYKPNYNSYEKLFSTINFISNKYGISYDLEVLIDINEKIESVHTVEKSPKMSIEYVIRINPQQVLGLFKNDPYMNNVVSIHMCEYSGYTIKKIKSNFMWISICNNKSNSIYDMCNEIISFIDTFENFDTNDGNDEKDLDPIPTLENDLSPDMSPDMVLSNNCYKINKI